ncbi:MAG TPA: aldo/keto reductase [Anaerolineales bacterium]|nr:aldo/keto reductase [Anaerolineales bacterium]
MKYEILPNLTLPKIGFGTWKIGGESSPDPNVEAISLAALRSALELGYTHLDTAEMYAAGHAEELIGQIVRQLRLKRESLFITSKVMPSHLKYDQILNSCDASLRRLQMDYLDLYLIHWPAPGMRLEDSFRALNKLVRDGQVRHLGVSNFDVKLLKRAQAFSETPIITDQVPYSLSDRSYVKNGVLEYCQQNDILLTAYSPVDQGHFRVSKTLRAIAQAHSAAPYQVAIAWLVNQPRVVTIPMSFNPVHIRENRDAADLRLSEAEMKQLAGAPRGL